MRALSLTLIVLFSATVLYGQGLQSSKFSSKDSIELSKTWKRYKAALNSKDTITLHSLSLKTVNCDLFEKSNPHATYNQDVVNSFISFSTFLTQFYHSLPKLKLWAVMKTKKYHIGLTAIDFHPPNIKIQKGKSQTIYNIWYITFEPNEIVKGDEGESEAFEFVKINGRFKFYGLTSIP